MAKLKVVHKWVGLGRVQSFMSIQGRVGLDHFTCGSGWVWSRKLDTHLTLCYSLLEVNQIILRDGPTDGQTHTCVAPQNSTRPLK